MSVMIVGLSIRAHLMVFKQVLVYTRTGGDLLVKIPASGGAVYVPQEHHTVCLPSDDRVLFYRE